MLRKTSYLLCITITLMVINIPVYGKVFQAGIEMQKDLPSGLYGSWEVTSERIETNNPYLFKRNSYDIWIFSKQNGYITLKNPETNAKSTININEVKSNTAIFSRQKTTLKHIEKEVCKINIENNNFYGVDTLIFEYYRGNQLLFIDSVKYKILGRKITGKNLNNLFAK